MNDDLISRQAAIEAIENERDYYLEWSEYEIEKGLRLAIEVLDDLPSAQGWIPINERLPRGQVEVIVSCHDDSGDTPFDYTSCGFTTTDGEYWIVDNEINNHVVAWMPLPEAYKGETE